MKRHLIQVRLSEKRSRDRDIARGLAKIESSRERAEFIRQAVYDKLYPKWQAGVTNEDLANRIDRLERMLASGVSVADSFAAMAEPEIVVSPEVDDVALAESFTSALKRNAKPGRRMVE